MKTRIFIILILIVLFTIFVTQNTQTITVKVFFWQFDSPEIAIFVYTGVAGVLTGFILASIFRPSKKEKSKNDDSLPYGKEKDDLFKENV